MVRKRRSLGKGLDALLRMPGGEDEAGNASPSVLPVGSIRANRFQPRRAFDDAALAELAASIKQHGLLQPILVRPDAAGNYELLAGERRWRAARMAGLKDIPAHVRPSNDNDAACIALVENLQREDLNPLEAARGMSRLRAEFKLTHEDIASAMGCSRSAVSNMLRLLELAPEALALLEQRELDMGHARALLGLDKNRQGLAAEMVARDKLSVRDTEKLVQSLNHEAKGRGAKATRKKSADPDILNLERSLSGVLSATVRIQHRESGSGRVVIGYGSLDELDSILEKIGNR